jgi:serine/threonine-protein kinase PpkA
VIQIPGYLIKKEMGSGGMATVYLALQVSLDREVAIKVMTPSLAGDPNFSRRFLTEARTLASLSHPNIVAVYDVGVTEAQVHYFSMQLLTQGDLSRRIRSGVSREEVARILSSVCRALSFAHQRGFVHRDVSPANILFDSSDNPVLTDFGIARAVTRTSRLTNAGVSVGTSLYMSPEQARGGNVDARSDIYSLGVVAYELLTGATPYNGEDGFAIAFAHVFEPIPRLPERDHAWQILIDKALAKDPSDRFADADQFLSCLELLSPQAAAAPNLDISSRIDEQKNVEVYPSVQELANKKTDIEASTIRKMKAVDEHIEGKVRVGFLRSQIWLRLASAFLLIIVVMGGGFLFGVLPLSFTSNTNDIAPRKAEELLTHRRENKQEKWQLEEKKDSVMPTSTAQDTGLLSTMTDAASTLTDQQINQNNTDALEVDASALQFAVATTVQDPVVALLALARSDLAAQRLGNPKGRNAIERYRLALRLAERWKSKSDMTRARQGLAETAKAYFALAEKAEVTVKRTEFLDFMRRSLELANSIPEGRDVAVQVIARLQSLHDQALEQGHAAMLAWDKVAAQIAYQNALEFDPKSADAQKGLKRAERMGTPGYVFRDQIENMQGPEMIVVSVFGKRIAVARSETMVSEFRNFSASSAARSSKLVASSCRDRESFFRSSRKYTFESPQFTQKNNHPVVCVSHTQAEAYAKWLSDATGRKYRLATLREWKALLQTQKNNVACQANVADAQYQTKYRNRHAYSCSDGYVYTSPVRSFGANTAGLYDMIGNVREWVSDCASNCREHIAVGISWAVASDKPDLAQTKSFGNDVASNTVGIRVVRELD